MVRNRKKKSLYEVIGKTWPKQRYEIMSHLEKTGDDTPRTTDLPASLSRLKKWPRRPRIMQFSVDRIELSIPYQIAIALLLGFILLILVVFRLGQSLSGQSSAESPSAMPESIQKITPQALSVELQTPAASEKKVSAPTDAENAIPADVKASNRIVIQTYQVRAHLEPVKQYFAQFGMNTEIKKIDNWYYLVTAEKYENPERPDTDGYLAKQKIIELGAKYKAPPGYETFGSSPFHDAYGMRFDD